MGMIDVTPTNRPDPSWRVVDSAGHVQALTEKRYWPDGEEYDAVVGYVCVECGEALKREEWPMRCADTYRQFIPLR